MLFAFHHDLAPQMAENTLPPMHSHPPQYLLCLVVSAPPPQPKKSRHGTKVPHYLREKDEQPPNHAYL